MCAIPHFQSPFQESQCFFFKKNTNKKKPLLNSPNFYTYVPPSALLCLPIC
eukprot:NODE_5229_length_523_cov_2.805907_g3868_i0.p3 GENE.NODE_5229_length_523_cov_2.805907_g3868_i0~~NODE_5229_length_523_cov_2.805907_g3868_i0.p3  ORF type:complete len:51 (+),score=1.48 NODE_5229_length_523_cov_2.805907_g3868_i0:65-217(+)